MANVVVLTVTIAQKILKIVWTLPTMVQCEGSFTPLVREVLFQHYLEKPCIGDHHSDGVLINLSMKEICLKNHAEKCTEGRASVGTGRNSIDGAKT